MSATKAAQVAIGRGSGSTTSATSTWSGDSGYKSNTDSEGLIKESRKSPLSNALGPIPVFRDNFARRVLAKLKGQKDAGVKRQKLTRASKPTTGNDVTTHEEKSNCHYADSDSICAPDIIEFVAPSSRPPHFGYPPIQGDAFPLNSIAVDSFSAATWRPNNQCHQPVNPSIIQADLETNVQRTASGCSTPTFFSFISGTSQGFDDDMYSEISKKLSLLLVEAFDMSRVEPSQRGERQQSPGGSSTSTGQSRGCGSSQNPPNEKPSNKRTRDEASSINESFEGSVTKTRRMSSQEDSEKTPLLACPFHKYDRIRHKNCSSLVLRGIARVTWHLTRQESPHRIPLHCSFCYEVFDDERRQTAHERQRNCSLQPERSWEGCVTSAQKLEMKKLIRKNKTPEDNWFEIFKYLFPGAPLPSSPYPEPVLTGEIGAFQDFAASSALPVIEEFMEREIQHNPLLADAEVQALISHAVTFSVNALFERYSTTNTAIPQSGTHLETNIQVLPVRGSNDRQFNQALGAAAEQYFLSPPQSDSDSMNGRVNDLYSTNFNTSSGELTFGEQAEDVVVQEQFQLPQDEFELPFFDFYDARTS